MNMNRPRVPHPPVGHLPAPSEVRQAGPLPTRCIRAAESGWEKDGARTATRLPENGHPTASFVAERDGARQRCRFKVATNVVPTPRPFSPEVYPRMDG